MLCCPQTPCTANLKRPTVLSSDALICNPSCPTLLSQTALLYCSQIVYSDMFDHQLDPPHPPTSLSTRCLQPIRLCPGLLMQRQLPVVSYSIKPTRAYSSFQTCFLGSNVCGAHLQLNIESNQVVQFWRMAEDADTKVLSCSKMVQL